MLRFPWNIKMTNIFLFLLCKSSYNLVLSIFRLLPAKEVVRRAESRIGCKGYDLMSNNCEHFACWCRYNVKISSQVIQIYVLLFVRSSMGLTIRHLSIRIFFPEKSWEVCDNWRNVGCWRKKSKMGRNCSARPPIVFLSLYFAYSLSALVKVHPHVHLSASLPLSVCLHVIVYACLSIYLYINLFVFQSICQYIVAVCLFIYLPIWLLVYLPSCL